jgi:hypothetical protein
MKMYNSIAKKQPFDVAQNTSKKVNIVPGHIFLPEIILFSNKGFLNNIMQGPVQYTCIYHYYNQYKNRQPLFIKPFKRSEGFVKLIYAMLVGTHLEFQQPIGVPSCTCLLQAIHR